MKKVMFIIFATALLTMLAFQNCGKKAFSQDTLNPTPNNPNGYVGGNSAIKIVINEYPVSQVISSDPQYVDYAVIPVSSTLKDVSCKLDSVNIPCEDKDRIEIKDLALGPHTFEIHAVNTQNESASEVISWTIYKRLITKTKDVTVQSNRTADVIINVDNSYSMADIQTNMAGRISNLINKLNTLDSYRISVITTDWYNSLPAHASYIDGQFIKFSNNTYCLTKGVANASSILGNAVSREESLLQETSGNGYERGIYTTYRAFERSKVAGSPEANCLRQNVAKHVILISDENEALYQEDHVTDQPVLSLPLTNGAKSNGDNLISFASNTYGSSAFTFHSIIINPFSAEGEQCLAQKQAFSPNSKYGTDYAKLSKKTKGIIGSVCAADYSTQLGAIGDSILAAEKTFGLDCTPKEVTGVLRLSNSQSYSDYSMSGNNIKFVSSTPNDTYRVTYSCFE